LRHLFPAGDQAALNAETLAEEQVALLNSNLATKADVAALQADVAALKPEILKWMSGGSLIAQGGLIVALVKLL